MKVLNAPVHLGSMVDNIDSSIEEVKSIWVVQRDDTLVWRIFRYLFSKFFIMSFIES